MGKSDLLKNSTKSELNGLISSTTPAKSEEKKRSEKSAEKGTAVHCNFIIKKSIHKRMKHLAVDLNMSLKDIVNEVMEEYLAKHEK